MEYKRAVSLDLGFYETVHRFLLLPYGHILKGLGRLYSLIICG